MSNWKFRTYKNLDMALNDLRNHNLIVITQEPIDSQNSKKYKIQLKGCFESQSIDIQKYLEESFSIICKGNYNQNENHMWIQTYI